MYGTRAITSRGLYIFYPISKEYVFVFKEVFSENSVLMYGLYQRAAYDGASTVFTMANCFIVIFVDETRRERKYLPLKTIFWMIFYKTGHSAVHRSSQTM